VHALERSFLYFPERAVVATPAEVGLSAEEVWLQADDGVQLHGYWLLGRGGWSGTAEAQPVGLGAPLVAPVPH
jgi:hypothetical protein